MKKTQNFLILGLIVLGLLAMLTVSGCSSSPTGKATAATGSREGSCQHPQYDNCANACPDMACIGECGNQWCVGGASPDAPAGLGGIGQPGYIRATNGEIIGIIENGQTLYTKEYANSLATQGETDAAGGGTGYTSCDCSGYGTKEFCAKCVGDVSTCSGRGCLCKNQGETGFTMFSCSNKNNPNGATTLPAPVIDKYVLNGITYFTKEHHETDQASASGGCICNAGDMYACTECVGQASCQGAVASSCSCIDPQDPGQTISKTCVTDFDGTNVPDAPAGGTGGESNGGFFSKIGAFFKNLFGGGDKTDTPLEDNDRKTTDTPGDTTKNTPLKGNKVPIPTEGTQLTGCFDSDNGYDLYVKGETTGTMSNGDYFDEIDSCATIPGTAQQYITDYYCYSETPTGGTPYESVASVVVVCPFGCADGKCVQRTVPGCTDTDNGINVYLRGTTTSTSSNVDSCTVLENAPAVQEYFCAYDSSGNGIMSSIALPCLDGCKDGACIQTRTDGERDNNNLMPGYGSIGQPGYIRATNGEVIGIIKNGAMLYTKEYSDYLSTGGETDAAGGATACSCQGYDDYMFCSVCSDSGTPQNSCSNKMCQCSNGGGGGTTSSSCSNVAIPDGPAKITPSITPDTYVLDGVIYYTKAHQKLSNVGNPSPDRPEGTGCICRCGDYPGTKCADSTMCDSSCKCLDENGHPYDSTCAINSGNINTPD